MKSAWSEPSSLTGLPVPADLALTNDTLTGNVLARWSPLTAPEGGPSYQYAFQLLNAEGNPGVPAQTGLAEPTALVPFSALEAAQTYGGQVRADLGPSMGTWSAPVQITLPPAVVIENLEVEFDGVTSTARVHWTATGITGGTTFDGRLLDQRGNVIFNVPEIAESWFTVGPGDVSFVPGQSYTARVRVSASMPQSWTDVSFTTLAAPTDSPALSFQAETDTARSAVMARVQGQYIVHAAVGLGTPLRSVAATTAPGVELTAEVLGAPLADGALVRAALQTGANGVLSPLGPEAQLELVVLPAPADLALAYADGALTATWAVDSRATDVMWTLSDANGAALAGPHALNPPLRWTRTPVVTLAPGAEYVLTGRATAGASVGAEGSVRVTLPTLDQLAASERAAGHSAVEAASALAMLNPGIAFPDLLAVLARAGYPATEATHPALAQAPGAGVLDVARAVAATYPGIDDGALTGALLTCGFSPEEVSAAVAAVLGQPLRTWMGAYRTDTQWWGSYFDLSVNTDGTVTVGDRPIAFTYDRATGKLTWDWQPIRDTRARGEITFSRGPGGVTFQGSVNPRPQDGPVGYTGTQQREPLRWPSSLNGPANRGYAMYRGPAQPNVAWQKAIGGNIRGGAAVDGAGMVYVGGENSRLYALRPDGSTSWEFGSTYPAYATPAVVEGTVYLGADGLIALTAEGAQRWRVDRRDIWMIVTQPPKVSHDGTTVYVLAISSTGRGDRLLAIDVAGARQKWEFVVPGGKSGSSCGIGADGTVYLGSEARAVYALDPATGQPRWSYQDPYGQGWIRGPIVIDPQGAVYYTRSAQNPGSNVVVCLNPDGTRRWEYAGDGYLANPPSIAIGADGTVFAGFYGMHAIAPDGRRKWATPTTNNVGIYPGAACVDRDGTVYFGAGGGLYAYDADGRLRWQYGVGASNSAPVLAGDGVLVFTAGNTVYMLQG